MEERIRRFVRDRAKARCEYCRLPEDFSGLLPFHIEHIRALQHRGTDDTDNLCWACSRCNYLKGPNPSAFDPLTDVLVELFNPRRDSWEEHFRWEGAVIVGISPEGRATIDLLQMNEERRLKLRIALLDNDEI